MNKVNKDSTRCLFVFGGKFNLAHLLNNSNGKIVDFASRSRVPQQQKMMILSVSRPVSFSLVIHDTAFELTEPQILLNKPSISSNQ